MKLLIYIATALCFAASPWPLACAASPADRLADLTFDPYELSFLPNDPTVAHLLRVSCDSGTYFQELFAAGEMPWFAPIDEDGFLLPDCACSFELRSVPSVEEIEGLESPAGVQFGWLEIAEGLINVGSDEPTRASEY